MRVRMDDARRVAVAVALGACTLASLLAGSSVDFSEAPASALAPRRGAFSVWGLVYTLLAASAVVLGSARDARPPSAAAAVVAPVLVCVSLALTCAWSGLVTRAPRGASLAVLAASAVAAWTAVGVLGDARGADLLVHAAAYGLLAGWLSVATTISLPTDDTRALAGAAGAVGAASVGLATPWPCAALLWGLAWQRAFDRAVVGAIVLALAGLGGAAGRAATGA